MTPPTQPYDPKRKYVLVTPKPGQATLSDLEWERRAAKERLDELTATRTAGQKWATALGSLTAVFAVVVLVKGPEDISEVAGSVSDWLPNEVDPTAWIAVLVGVMLLPLAALADVLNRASSATAKWAGALPLAIVVVGCAVVLVAGADGDVTDGTWMLVFLLGAVALVGLGAALPGRWPGLKPYLPATWLAAVAAVVLAGFALGQGTASWELVVIISLGCAVALAGVSILAGARTAYGPVSFAAAPSGARMRTQERREVRRSRRWLLLAIYSAVAAVGFIGLGVAVTWLRTPDEAPAEAASPNLLVLRGVGAPVCGAFEHSSDATVFIRRPEAKNSKAIRWTAVRALTVVDACPGPEE